MVAGAESKSQQTERDGIRLLSAFPTNSLLTVIAVTPQTKMKQQFTIHQSIPKVRGRDLIHIQAGRNQCRKRKKKKRKTTSMWYIDM